MSLKDYQGYLHPALWHQLSLDQRVGVLQDLENDYAEQQGRAAYKIEAKQMPELGRCGWLDHAQCKILINADHVQNDAFLFVAVHTVLHEGRHAYQRAAIDHDGLHPDRGAVELWRHNATVYVSNSEKMFVIYRNQPIERDAEAYANLEMHTLYDQLQQLFGKIEDYQRYAADAAQEARFVEKAAIQKYGPTYAADIATAISEAYEIKKGLNANKAFRISVKFDEGSGWISKTVSMELGAKSQLRQKLADEARNFALKEAMRMGISPEGVKGAETKIDAIPIEHHHTKQRSIERGRGLE